MYCTAVTLVVVAAVAVVADNVDTHPQITSDIHPHEHVPTKHNQHG